MLNLDQKLTLNVGAIDASNLCDRFSGEDLKRIGRWVVDGYKRDKTSRAKWEQRNAAAMDLAMIAAEFGSTGASADTGSFQKLAAA